uniref:Uncharacterized protein n=1 Tax=Cacopsylla melanoneura TaxID=428564 RepID=A0A8D8QS65_9HEMI
MGKNQKLFNPESRPVQFAHCTVEEVIYLLPNPPLHLIAIIQFFSSHHHHVVLNIFSIFSINPQLCESITTSSLAPVDLLDKGLHRRVDQILMNDFKSDIR